MEMSITRALNELKLLDSRIDRAIRNGTFVASNKKSAKNVGGVVTKEDFNKSATADYSSIIDLIERRKQIKSSIVESNARTEVVIGEYVMTVADAIERKNSIAYEKSLLSVMKRQFANQKADMQMRNENVEDKLNNLLETMMGKEVKNIDRESNEFAVQYRKDNEFELVDPLSLELKIKNLENEIEDFENEVDYILSESNTITKITIED